MAFIESWRMNEREKAEMRFFLFNIEISIDKQGEKR